MEKKTRKRFVLSYLFLGLLTFFSVTAEFWSNDRPILMYKDGRFSSPLVREHHARELGIQDRMVVDYKTLELKKGEWALWPLNRWSPYETNKTARAFPAAPSRENWLGTDDRGRDILARLLYGFRLSLVFAVALWFLSTLLAVTIGAATGYAGGWVDMVSQRVIEILSTVPQFFILIFLISLFEPSLTMLVLVSALCGWIGLSYYIRGEALRIRKLEFIEAARAYGASHVRILLRHVLPNCLTPVLTFTPFVLVANITGLAALDFLGFGLPPPTPSWGELLQQGQSYFSTAWWLAVFPAFALFIALLTITLVGEHLRLVLDPHSIFKVRGFAPWTAIGEWLRAKRRRQTQLPAPVGQLAAGHSGR